MTQEESRRRKVCARCKWCLQETINHQLWTDYKFKCMNSILSADPVTGDETYLDCSYINRDGECSMYEEKERSPLLKIFEFFK